jgi:T4-like virus tail tube protein gp19
MSAGFNISTFKSRGLTYGGVRPALFEVFLTPPPNIGIDPASQDKFRFTASGASIPAGTLGEIEIGYFGRKIKLAGDRTFADWTVSVMNDEDYLVRSMIEKWSNAINTLESNVRVKTLDNEAYKTDMQVIQYSKEGKLIRDIHMVGVWPANIGEMELNWDSTNQIQRFNVTFAYDYWLPMEGTEGGNGASTGNAYLAIAKQ